MNRIILLACGLLMPFLSKAQYVKVGPEVGVTYQTMSQTIYGNEFKTEYQMGLQLGAVVDIEINNDFYVQPGVLFKTQVGGLSSFEDNFSSGAGLPTSVFDRREYSINTLHIPIYVMFKTGEEFDDSKFFVGLAPYLDINVGGRFYQKYTHALNGVGIAKKKDEVVEFGSGHDKHFKRINVGLEAAIGYEFSFGLYIKANYGMGFLNMSPIADSQNKFYNHGGGISIGFLVPTQDRQF